MGAEMPRGSKVNADIIEQSAGLDLRHQENEHVFPKGPSPSWGSGSEEGAKKGPLKLMQ